MSTTHGRGAGSDQLLTDAITLSIITKESHACNPGVLINLTCINLPGSAWVYPESVTLGLTPSPYSGPGGF